MARKKQDGKGRDYLLETIAHQRVMKFREEYPKTKHLDWKCKMLRAGISKEFWHISFRNFWGNKKNVGIARRYCKSLKIAREHGFGFLFMGANGRGKTSLIMLILKQALKKGYTALYITMPMIFRQIYLSWDFPEVGKELMNLMKTIDFLAIGELGKDYHRKDSTEFARAEFDCLFRARREECLPILMDTNMGEEELEDTYGESLMSLFMSRLKFITMVGVDYRRKVQKQEWAKMIGG